MNSQRLKAAATFTAVALALCLGFASQVSSAEAATVNPLFDSAMQAVHGFQLQLKALSSTVAGFANSFSTKELTFTSANGQEASIQTVNAQTLCIGSTCIDEAQLQALLAEAGTPDVQSVDATTTEASSTITESPVIQVNGDNPAIVQVGDTYQDPGAIITGPQQDLNLAITTYVNGVEMSPVQIDTSAVATDTIDYVATDQNGLTSTSTRVVIIEPAASSNAAATTTNATTTAQ